MKKFVATLDAYNLGQVNNPAQCSFWTEDTADDGEVAGRIAAMFYHLSDNQFMSTNSLREITVSPGSGPGTVVPVNALTVAAYVTAANAAGAPTPVTVPANGNTSWYGLVVGPSKDLLPLGTSILVSETPQAGPKGRIFVPYAGVPTLTPEGGISPANVINLAKTMEIYYGLVTGSGALEGPLFGVKSAAGFSKVQSLRASVRYARLKSRSR